MKKKPKIGRPTMKARDRLSVTVQIRLTSEENREATKAAKKARMSKSEWVRDCMRRCLQKGGLD